jgi:hypothetical protein
MKVHEQKPESLSDTFSLVNSIPHMPYFYNSKTPALRSLVCPKADTLEPPVLGAAGLLLPRNA